MTGSPRRTAFRWALAAVLVAAAVAVYWPVGHYPFINYDDPGYVAANPAVQAGLTLEGVRWAFTTTHLSNWHPLTWLSHMLDVSLFGQDPGSHHLVNLVLHLLNTLLLFLVAGRMTGTRWRAAAVAALFALHPLHVESVAWVAERKDVLCALFFFLSLWCYGRYAERPGWARYLPLFVFMALGLLSKPMIVTLPFVLLLLDYWPLGRLRLSAPALSPVRPAASTARLVLEKIPLMALSAASSAIAYAAQQEGQSIGRLPWEIRAGNAAVSYLAYLWKTVWPSSLAVFYPHPRHSLSLATAAGALLIVCGATAFALLQARRRPWLAAGWLWYLGTLVPVIGLVQVGNQAMADRYTYIPLVGIFVAAAWGAADVAARWRVPRWATASMAGGWLCALALCAWFQVGYWRGPVPLFTHAAEVTRDNWVAHHFLGEEALSAGRYEEAIAHFGSTLRLVPFAFESRNNLAVALTRAGRTREAAAVLAELLRMDPANASARFNMGVVLEKEGRLDEAAARFEEVLRLEPGDPSARARLDAIRSRRRD